MPTPFRKRALAVVSGTAIAQIIGVAVNPILTRLFKVEEFADFAIFNSYLMVVACFICLMWPRALVVAESNQEAWSLRYASFFMSVFWTLLSLVVVVVAEFQPMSLWMLFPLAVFTNGWLQIEYGWSLRFRREKVIASSRVAQTAITSVIQVFMPLVTTASSWVLGVGLVVGSVAGAFFSWFFNREKPTAVRSREDFVKIVRKNINYPMMSAPSEILNTLTIMLPAMLLPLAGFHKEAAYIFLATKVTNLPFGLITTSLFNVYLTEISNKQSDQVIASLKNLIIKLGGLSLPFAIVLLLFAPELFAFVFGENWAVAGDYQIILTVWMFPRFLLFPAFAVFDAFKRLSTFFYWSLFMVSCQVFGMLLGLFVYESTQVALWMFSIGGLVGTLAQFAAAIRILKLSRNH